MSWRLHAHVSLIKYSYSYDVILKWNILHLAHVAIYQMERPLHMVAVVIFKTISTLCFVVFRYRSILLIPFRIHSLSRGTWWRHQMETFAAILAFCARNSPITGEFPSQTPVTRSFDVFYLRLNKRLSKQSWGWWFETPPHSLWRNRNEVIIWLPQCHWSNTEEHR